MKALIATGAAISASGAMVLGLGATAPTRAADPVAQTIDNFELTDHTRLAHQLYYFGYAPAIVLMTRENGSAVSARATQELASVATGLKDKGVLFYLLDSKLTDTREAVAAEAAKQDIAFPILMDERQLVGEQLGVKREGEVFVIEPQTWTVAYRGPVAGATAAIARVMDSKVTTTTQVALNEGRTIAFPAKARAADFAKISYANDVAPVLQEKCASCHLTGGIGPFAMDSYEVIKGFAPMIRETVRTRRMPPYFADPHIGTFKNDQGLTADETKLLVHWIEAGAPRGAGPDPLLVNKGRVASDWPETLGNPDVVVDIPAFKIPASGLIEYKNPNVANPFTQDTWLRAIAIKPGDRSVLHHVISNWSPSAGEKPAAIPGGSVGSYTPGAQPQVMADGVGAPIPAGGKLHFQLHYTTTGKETEDRTQVGFYTLKTTPKYVKRSTVIGDFALFIPAGEARHKEVAYQTFPADAYIYTLYPHAHYRGYHVELKMISPDGRETMLLSLPKYDFNWQRDYDPVKPIFVKAGSKLVATWVYDNSIHNPANPDPKRNVTWGEQTPDEMMYFRINYRWADETVAHLRPDLQTKLFQSMMLGVLDDDVNGKVELAELRGRMGLAMKPRFADLDRNKDGGLDAQELAVMGGVFRRVQQETPDL
jgi:peroxiredoxin